MTNFDFFMKMALFMACALFTILAVNTILSLTEDYLPRFTLSLFYLSIAGFLYVLLTLPISVPKQDLLSILKTNGTGVLSGLCRPHDKQISLQGFLESDGPESQILLDFSLNENHLGSYVFNWEGSGGDSNNRFINSVGYLILPVKDSKEFEVHLETKTHDMSDDILKFYAILIPKSV